MPDGYTRRHRSSRIGPTCEFERTLTGEYCAEYGEMELGGLRLCRHHAELLGLDEQADYLRATVAHIRLWTEEARRRGRGDLVRRLETERARAAEALGRVDEELRRRREGKDGGVRGEAGAKAGAGGV